MERFRDRVRDRLMLHGGVLGLWLLVEVTRRRNVRLRRALAGFCACYQFRARGGSARRLIFGGGRARTLAGAIPAPDYEICLLDPPGILRQLARDPDDVLRLLLEGKIDQRGNPYYLFKLGYLISLCQGSARQLGRAFWRIPGRGEAGHVG